MHTGRQHRSSHTHTLEYSASSCSFTSCCSCIGSLSEKRSDNLRSRWVQMVASDVECSGCCCLSFGRPYVEVTRWGCIVSRCWATLGKFIPRQFNKKKIKNQRSRRNGTVDEIFTPPGLLEGHQSLHIHYYIHFQRLLAIIVIIIVDRIWMHRGRVSGWGSNNHISAVCRRYGSVGLWP